MSDTSKLLKISSQMSNYRLYKRFRRDFFQIETKIKFVQLILISDNFGDFPDNYTQIFIFIVSLQKKKFCRISIFFNNHHNQ